jgi:hypothetical protein
VMSRACGDRARQTGTSPYVSCCSLRWSNCVDR